MSALRRRLGVIFAKYALRWKTLSIRSQRMIVAGVLVLIIGAGTLIYLNQPLSATEREAVKAASDASAGFEKNSVAQSYAQLNKAVEYASKWKCDEARAIYDTVFSAKTEISDLNKNAYKKRIDTLCARDPSQVSTELDEG